MVTVGFGIGMVLVPLMAMGKIRVAGPVSATSSRQSCKEEASSWR
jgi:hypothetical protein